MASKKKQEEGEEAAFPLEELPLEVQSSVLGWLPLRSLFRSKCVCKFWNTTISAPSFAHRPSLLPFPARVPNPPWLIFFTPKSFDFLLAFDFEALSWFKFEVGFLSSKLNSLHASSAPFPQQGFVWCIGSASGLLLLDFRSSLHVCNPLTKSLFRLAPFKSIVVPITQGFSSTRNRSLLTNAETTICEPTHTYKPSTDGVEGSLTNTHSENNVIQGSSTAVYTRNNVSTSLSTGNSRGNAEGADCTMRTHRQTHDYTLISIGKAKTDLAIEAYCAGRNSWNVVGSLPISFIIKHDQMMECNGLFFSLLLKPIGMLVVGESDGKGGPIWRIQAMPVHYGKETRRLLACRNAIFMVCPVDQHNNGFEIWRFQPDTRAWIKMHDMPGYILQDVKSVASSNWVDCVGVGNFICFRALCSLRVLTYNLCDDVWSWLPEPAHAYDSFFARGLQFEPRLDFRPAL